MKLDRTATLLEPTTKYFVNSYLNHYVDVLEVYFDKKYSKKQLPEHQKLNDYEVDIYRNYYKLAEELANYCLYSVANLYLSKKLFDQIHQSDKLDSFGFRRGDKLSEAVFYYTDDRDNVLEEQFNIVLNFAHMGQGGYSSPSNTTNTNIVNFHLDIDFSVFADQLLPIAHQMVSIAQQYEDNYLLNNVEVTGRHINRELLLENLKLSVDNAFLPYSLGNSNIFQYEHQDIAITIDSIVKNKKIILDFNQDIKNLKFDNLIDKPKQTSNKAVNVVKP